MSQLIQAPQKIAVLTSGGDAPGMNAAIRAVARMCSYKNKDIIGIQGGYAGILNEHMQQLFPRDLANVIQRGGTFLKTGRFLDFHKPEVRAQAAEILKKNQIDFLIVIGGDGSFQGAHLLWEEQKIPVIGIPGTIDNDIFGTDLSIGFDTAVNTALAAIDKIRDTADSHDRIFIVEVMGRNSGFIASYVGLAGGAEEIFTPDMNTTVDKAVDRIRQAQKRGKKSSIIITPEGQKPGRAYDLADAIRKKSNFESKVCILGHQQRGGSPTATDRILASRMGAAAIESALAGTCDVMIALQGQQLVTIPLETVLKNTKKTPLDYIALANILAT